MRADLRHARRQNHIIQRGAADKCVVSHRHDPVAEFDRRDPACPAVPRRVMLRSIVGNCPAALNFKNIPVFPVVGKTCRHRIGQLPGRIFLRLRTPRKERRKQNKRCQNRHQSQTLFCSVHIVFFLTIVSSIAKCIRSFSRQIVSASMAGRLCRTLKVALFLLLSVFCPSSPSLCVPFGIFPVGFTRIITRFFMSVNTLKKILSYFRRQRPLFPHDTLFRKRSQFFVTFFVFFLLIAVRNRSFPFISAMSFSWKRILGVIA